MSEPLMYFRCACCGKPIKPRVYMPRIVCEPCHAKADRRLAEGRVIGRANWRSVAPTQQSR
jgi:Zn finger protein HypA/HybF involved in hydrogenase expression